MRVMNLVKHIILRKMFDKFKQLYFKKVNTPFDHSVKLQNKDRRVVAQLEYESAIGCLVYLVQCTRSDITFAV